MELKAYGDRGVLIAALEDRVRERWIQCLEAGLPDGCEEFVVGFDSILLVGQKIALEFIAGSENAANTPSLERFIKAAAACGVATQIASTVSANVPRIRIVGVHYNGADLATVARSCGLTVRQVIELHCAPIYSVRMMGFSPGFPYLEGLDPRLHLDRRPSPRNRIEAGTVAIGGPHAGIYSVASPGGWHLLGHTDLRLFDLEAAGQPDSDPKKIFALSPGDQLRFQPKEGA